VAEEEERHARGFLDETSPADKAKMTIAEFCERRPRQPPHQPCMAARQAWRNAADYSPHTQALSKITAHYL
jgi:hypothetical protein